MRNLHTVNTVFISENAYFAARYVEWALGGTILFRINQNPDWGSTLEYRRDNHNTWHRMSLENFDHWANAGRTNPLGKTRPEIEALFEAPAR
jgi:hypothetical protein